MPLFNDFATVSAELNSYQPNKTSRTKKNALALGKNSNNQLKSIDQISFGGWTGGSRYPTAVEWHSSILFRNSSSVGKVVEKCALIFNNKNRSTFPALHTHFNRQTKDSQVNSLPQVKMMPQEEDKSIFRIIYLIIEWFDVMEFLLLLLECFKR